MKDLATSGNERPRVKLESSKGCCFRLILNAWVTGDPKKYKKKVLVGALKKIGSGLAKELLIGELNTLINDSNEMLYVPRYKH